jgi:DoxX-like family
MRPSAAHFGILWSRYWLIWAAELAAAGVVIGLWWHPLGVAAAAGMALLLIGALITHRRAEDGGKEIAPALLGLAITLAYLAIALTTWAWPAPRSSVTAGQGMYHGPFG